MKVMESEYYNILGETGTYWFEEIILKSNYQKAVTSLGNFHHFLLHNLKHLGCVRKICGARLSSVINKTISAHQNLLDFEDICKQLRQRYQLKQVLFKTRIIIKLIFP
jgi:hypothetical protein